MGGPRVRDEWGGRGREGGAAEGLQDPLGLSPHRSLWRRGVQATQTGYGGVRTSVGRGREARRAASSPAAGSVEAE